MTSEIDQLRQAWVTTVLDREDLLKALVLRRSFRRVMTTRPFVVIITPLLHSKHRILLSKEFDQIFLLDHPTDDGNGLTLKDYAKLFAFTLQIFRKCVYLDAGSLILKNCDDIFDSYTSFNAVVNDSIINGRDNGTVDSSVFFFVPSVEIYEALVTSMKTKHISCKAAFEEYVKAWMVNQSKDFLFMDSKYSRIIGRKCEGLMALEENNIGIVHFKDDLKLPQEDITSLDLGTLEYAALQLWLSIYETEVAALMSSLEEVQENCTPILLSGPSNNISLRQPHEPIAIVGMSCRAGYLEMCLAAGHSTTQCFTDAFYPPASAFALEHLKILKPLMLENGKVCQMQTVVDCSGSSSSTDKTASGMTVKIFAQLKYENELPKWVQHATAQFSPIACNADIQKVKPICVKEMKKKLGVFQTEDFYGKLEKMGLEFGPSFRSLQQVWKSKEESILAQTKHIEMNGYIIHPTIFDAMIQVAMIALSKDKPVDKLHVPLSIKKCVWLEQQKKLDGNLYIHCNLQEPDVVTLYDEDGTPLAMMEGVELIQTSVQQIETMMDNHKSEIPLCWEETWKRKGLGSWEKRVDTKMLSLEDTFLSNREFDYSQFDEISDDELLIENQLDKLVYLYILNAFYKLGWNTELTLRVGEEIQLNKFMNNLSIIKAHSRLTFHFLEILEEENILKKTGENMWTLVKLPGDENEVQKNIKLIQTNLRMEEEIEFQLVVSCGRSLASILKGDDNGLRILFPEVSSKSSPSAATFYTTCYARKNVYEKFVQVLETYLQPLVQSQLHQQQEVVLRLLEVGAGAGSFTEHVLSLLEKFNLPFEYTYTDISQSFFSKAENKFEMHKKNMKFKILNIEQDPATQGFCPGYYDIVLAGDVVHATKDLRESISNIRKLLRPNGCVWLEESTIPCREVTLIFGLLEGYWRYTDLDLRPNHAVVSANKLENVMKTSCGFSETFSVTCYKGYHGLIFGRASEIQLDSKFIKETEKKDTWLLFFNKNIWTKDHLLKIQNLLISAGKTPVLVEQSEKFMWSPTICAVRPNNKSDLNQLLTRITSRIDTTLEGVIYGWGITTNTNYDQASISQPYLYLLQILAELNVRKIPKVFMISEGVIPISGGDYNFANNPSVGTLCGISKSFHNEYPNIPCRIIDLCVDDEIDTKISQIFAELWIEDKETQVAYRDGKRLFNWGAWGQVGVAVGKEFPGVPPFSLERGLNALGRILRDQRTQVCVAEVQMTVFQKFFGGIHTYLEDVLYKDSDKSGRNEGATSVNSELFWKQLDCAETPEEKLGVIRENVKSVIRQILKLDKNEPIDDNNTFQEIGLDSLMMVEMKNLLQGILGKRISLTANDLKDCKEFKQLIRDDSQLPPHIRSLDTNVPARNIKDCRIFMITGVTGNLGPYFIRDLFKHTLVTKIYCLVRAKNDESGRQRLISILTERGLLNSIDLTRISCVAGDLTKPKFGLSEEIYEKLADEVDAVIHSAVKSSHIEIYRKSDVSSDIRNVNVKGTISVLEFATVKKTKHVLHASTLLAVSTTDDDGSLSEDWPNVDDFDNLTQLMGYPISKFICDMLMKEAVLERKIPCKVFRLSAIAGDSITGRFNYQNNHLLMRLLSYMRVRSMPSVPLPLNVLPVDTCADITLSVFFNPDAPQDIYNVCQEKPQHEQAFVEVAKEMGYEIDVVEFADFVKKLEEEGEGSLLYSLRDLYLNEELYTSIFFGPEALQEWFVNPEEFFKCRKVAKYYGKGMGKEFPSSMEIIKRDLRFAKEQGIFQKLGV
ncbi:unnamed protein product [Orchesella dallaii]|uniref:Uncharacterized protein n=1 Tax=Orchesella dallaii TaxID=48710 RepID=A0ABP1R605_9HEXA